MNNKGFINFIVVGVVGVALIASLGFFTDYRVKQAVQNNLGATIATTSLSDTINTFRTNTNTSLENINNQLESVSSTIGTYGTMATVNSPAPVANGGTGLATGPTNGQIFASNGTTPAWKTLVPGSGITISSTTTSTTINSTGVDTTAAFNWSGAHTFSAGVTSTATTSLANTTIGGTASTISSTNLNITGTTTFSGNVVGVSTSTISKLGRSVLTSASGTIYVSGLPQRDFYYVNFWTPGVSSAESIYIRFNNDSTANIYSFRTSENNAAQTAVPANRITMNNLNTILGSGMLNGTIYAASSTQPKMFTFQAIVSTSTDHTVIPVSIDGYGWHRATTTLSSIYFLTSNPANTFNIGTTLEIYGSKD